MALRTPQHKEFSCRDKAGPIVEAIEEPRKPSTEDEDPHLDDQSSLKVTDEQDEHRKS